MKIISLSKIFFCFVITSLSFLNAQGFKEIEKTFQLTQDGKLFLDTYKGEIKIETWNKNEVYVHAIIVPDENGFFNTSPQKQLARARIEFDATPNSIHIKSEYKKSNNWFGGETRALINYTIKLPQSARLEIKDYKSRSFISGIRSSISFETYKGNSKIIELSGDIKLETYKGEIDVRFLEIRNHCRFETYKGDVKISVPQTSHFTIDAHLGKKTDFHSDFLIDGDVINRDKNEYNIKKDINGGGHKIYISSQKGDVELIKK